MERPPLDPCCFLASGHYKSDTHRPWVVAPDVVVTDRMAPQISLAPSSAELASTSARTVAAGFARHLAVFLPRRAPAAGAFSCFVKSPGWDALRVAVCLSHAACRSLGRQ